MRAWIPVAAVASLLVIGESLRGQMVLTMTDGTTTRGSFGGIAKDGSWSWEGTGGRIKVPAGRVVGLEAGEAAPAIPDDGFKIELSTGDALIGRIEDGASDDLRLRNPAFGDVTFPLDDVAAIWNLALPRAPESLPPPQGKAETLYVDRDGRIDYIQGTLEKIGKTQLTFTGDAGQNRVFSYVRDKVIAVKSAAATKRGGTGRELAHCILRLKDGSRLTGGLRPSDGVAIAIKLTAGPEMVVDARYVRSLAILSESLRYLSDLEPAKLHRNPADRRRAPDRHPARPGLGSGQPLRIGRRAFSKGILVPARSRVTYALDGKFARFAASVGADGGGTGAELAGAVKASISVDGKSLWSSGLLRSGQPPESVDVSGLAGGKELAIEVEFADSFDAGARAVFGNAMLIR